MDFLVSKKLKQIIVFRIRNNDGEIATIDDMAIQFPALHYKPPEMGIEFRGAPRDVDGRNRQPPDNIKTL